MSQYQTKRTSVAHKSTTTSRCSRFSWLYSPTTGSHAPGLALCRDTHQDTAPYMVLERPKVLYNVLTDTFVMWMHIDDADYKQARLGVAVSKSPIGPFTFERSFRPHGQESRDFTVWKDPDTGIAYVAYSSADNGICNKTMHISTLTEDLKDVSSQYSRVFTGQSREAPAFFKFGDCFMMATSGCSGWDPNQLEVFWTRDPLGEWASLGDPCTGSSETMPASSVARTFLAQPNFVMAVPGLPGAFVFMADRWNSQDLPASRYVWLPFWVLKKPLTVEDNNDPPVELHICWRDEWTMANMRNYKCETRLIDAAAHGRLPYVEALLDAGVDVNMKNSQGWTALMKAASGGHLHVAQRLVAHGADIDARCKSGSSALMHAAWAGRSHIVRYLLSAKADIAARDNEGWPALHTAVKRGRAAVSKILLDNGADIAARHPKGDTALMHAAWEGHVEIVTDLLAAGADVNIHNLGSWTALMNAASRGHVDVAKALILRQATIHATSAQGDDALLHAVWEGHLEVAAALLAAGADVNSHNHKGRTPLMNAASRGHVDVAKALVDHEANVHATCTQGSTALMHAAWSGHLDMVNYLLSVGADKTAHNHQGETAVMTATQQGHTAVVQALS